MNVSEAYVVVKAGEGIWEQKINMADFLLMIEEMIRTRAIIVSMESPYMGKIVYYADGEEFAVVYNNYEEEK